MDAQRIIENLEALTLAELRQVEKKAHELVERIEAWQADAIEVLPAAGGCYRLEQVKCGKARCKKCAEGPGHGPYWYRYHYSGGRTKKTYIGKERPHAD
jgi:hypothetical protein